LEVSHWLGGINLSVTGWQNQGGWWFNQESRCLYIYLYIVLKTMLIYLKKTRSRKGDLTHTHNGLSSSIKMECGHQ
jgi:hypothetical protein